MAAGDGQPRRRRRVFATAALAAGATACVLAAAAALALALSRGWQRDRVTAWLERALADRLHAEVSIGALEGPLLPTFTLRDVRITSGGGSQIGWQSLDARIDATALVTRRVLVVERLALERPALVLAGEEWGPAEPGGGEGTAEASKAGGLAVPIELRDVEISDARWRIATGARAIEGEARLQASGLAVPLRPDALRRSRGTLEVGIAPTSIADVALERGDLRASLADGALTLAIDGLEGPAGRLHGHGEADLASWLEGRDEAHAELALAFESLDLEALVGRPEAKSALSGSLELAARRPRSAPPWAPLSATLSTSELHFELSLDPSRLAVGPVQTARAVGQLADGSWTLESLAVHAQAFDLEARGRGASSGLEQLSGSLRVPALERLAPWLPAGWTLAGGVAIEADLEGPLASLTGHGSLHADHLVARDVALGTVDARIASETPGVLRVETLETRGGALEATLLEPARIVTSDGGVRSERVALALAGQPLTLDGGLSREGFRALHVRAEGVEVAPLARLAGLDEPVAGRADGDLTLDGAFARPRLAGTLDVAPLAVAGARAERVDLAFTPHEGMLDATARVRALGREVLSARLQAPSDAGAELFARSETRLEVQSDGFDLGLVAPFLPRGLEQPGGRLDLTLRVAGGRPAPTIEGSVTLAAGRLGVPLVGQVFEPIEGRARVSGSRLVVDSLGIGEEGGKGTARLQGSLDFAQLDAPRTDLTLSLDGFPLSRTRLLTSDASGRIALSGALRAPELTGALSLADALLRLPEPEDATLREIRVVSRSSEAAPLEIREGAEAQAGWLEAAALDLSLEVPRNSWVRGGGAELEVTGTVRVRKDHGEPARFTGEAEAVRGSYTFQGRRFRVQRGTATFDGISRPDPLLDVEAAYRVRDVTILAYLSGRASDPKLRLAGEPPMPDDDILAYLLFGRPADELAAGEGAGLGDAATKAAAGIAARELASLLGESMPVDTIELNAGDAGQPAGFGVGKYVGDRVFLRYGRTLGPRPTDEVRTELRVTPHVSVESQITSDETGGLDVIWTYDY